MSKQPKKRLFWEDCETGERGFVDNGELPAGALVEQITAFEFYEREGTCVCGKKEKDGVRCRYGASHASIPSPDDEALL